VSENEHGKRMHQQIQREIAEASTLRARYQAQLDRLWWDRREAELEARRLKRDLDPYNLGLYDDDFMFPKKG
jgi:hypothetical protein